MTLSGALLKGSVAQTSPSSKSIIRRRRTALAVIPGPPGLAGLRLLQPLAANAQLAAKVLPALGTVAAPRIALGIRRSLREDLAAHAVRQVARHPLGQVVAQLAVRRVPQDRHAVLAPGALDDGRRGRGRAGCEGHSREDGAVEFVEALAVLGNVYEL